MKTLKEVALKYGINVNTLRKRANFLKINTPYKAPKTKAFLYSQEQIDEILGFQPKSNHNPIKIVYVDRSFKEVITETYYIYQSKMNYGI